MLKSLDAAAVRRWAATCCDELAAHYEEIDDLNVFPVADQDTGSNLLATMRAGLAAVLREDSGDDAAAGPAAALARGALLGARGNSGVIVSQVLRGLAESLADGTELDGPAGDGPARGGAALREGLRRAEELATAAVSEPVPGTVLTVLHAAAQAAAIVPSDDLCDVASAAAAAAACALADTPRQLAVLARAGVVDAGGQGLVLLLEALLTVVTERSGRWPVVAVAATPTRALQAQRESGSAEYESEVMYLLDAADEASVATLRAELGELGDCVAVVSTGEALGGGAAALWNVHVHCSDVGAVIEAGVRAGRPHRVTVLRFADQAGTDQAGTGGPDRFGTGHAVLVMVSGSGVAELLRREGAVVIPPNSSVTELLAVLTGTRARHVTVLAGAGSAARVAEAAAAQARDTGQDVVVVPMSSPVQALAAMAVHGADRRTADDLVAMTEAAAATRRGELSTATQEALTKLGRCQPGELLGMVDDEVVLIERDPLAAACKLLDRMLSAGGELVTVLLGQHAPDDLGKLLAEHLRGSYPEVEAVVYQGGQPDSVLLVGVE